MSLVSIRPYFRDRLTQLGFTEWSEPFDAENIPSSLIDMAYHWQITDISGADRSNLDQQLDAEVEVRLFFKGFRDPSSTLDTAIKKSELIISDLIKPSNFQDVSPAIANVSIKNVRFDPFDNELNDNVVLVRMIFETRVFVCIE